VTRDDLQDGGAGQFVKAIKAVRGMDNSIKIEVLTPDFKGDYEALRSVLNAHPDVFNHNVETVPRLYSSVRQMADYSRSINVIKFAADNYSQIKAKSGIMLGLGEKESEVLAVMKDLRGAGCDFLTIGQYLRPRRTNIPVVEYIKPEVFTEYKAIGLDMGFEAVASSPLTRSSLDADKMIGGG
jgi:lipoic acid synthetase